MISAIIFTVSSAAFVCIVKYICIRMIRNERRRKGYR